jgi:hypothetical protein
MRVKVHSPRVASVAIPKAADSMFTRITFDRLARWSRVSDRLAARIVHRDP